MRMYLTGSAFIPLFLSAILMSCPLPGQAQDLDSVLEQARTEQSSERYAAAAVEYAKATKLSPNAAELWANRGVMEYLAGSADISIESLKHALQLNHGLFTPMLFLGKAYVQKEKPALALPFLNSANSMRPEDVEVLLTMGHANQLLHRPRAAGSAYAKASGLSPTNPAAFFGLGVASLEVIELDGRDLATSTTRSLWSQVLYAEELFAQGRPLEAVTTYTAATASASPMERAALSHTLDQMTSQTDVFPLPPASVMAMKQLTTQLTPKPGARVATECSSKAAGSRSHSAISGSAAQGIQNAACAYWAGDYARSASESSKALQRLPHNGEALYWSVKANERVAVAALSQFEMLAPQSAATYDLVGDLYRHQRQPDGALEQYKKALAIDAHDPEAQVGAAAAFLSEGKPAQAEPYAQSALADHPLEPQLNLLMAETLVAQHEYARSAPYLDKCLTAPPEYLPRVHALLGRVDAENGKDQEAIKHLELALSSDEDGSLHYQLSRLYRKTGHVAEAQKAQEEAKVLIAQRLANAKIAIQETDGSNPKHLCVSD